MADYSSLNDNPELLAWLNGLEAKVAERNARNESRNEESKVFLPKIRMNQKFYQNNNRTYPEMQGSINFLPVIWKGQRVVELNKVVKVWCPADKDWSSGYMYNILSPDYYPEGEVRDKITALRDKALKLLDSGKVDWHAVKRTSYSLIKAFVLIHRNSKGEIISSNLYGGDQVVEHKNVPAVIICPVNRIQEAIQNDLNSKVNPAPYALACYSDVPIQDRKGWVSMTFKEKGGGAIGYNISVSTELVNPMIMTDKLIPESVNLEDERFKLLFEADPIKVLLDRRQVGTEDGVYYNPESIELLQGYIDSLDK